MKGFKNSTRVQYMKGGSCDGYAKGGQVKGAAKISKVMGEFKSGTLHSGDKKGPEVTNPKQAVAIALSEARRAGAKAPMKKASGGPVTKPQVSGGPAPSGVVAPPMPAGAAAAAATRQKAAELKARTDASLAKARGATTFSGLQGADKVAAAKARLQAENDAFRARHDPQKQANVQKVRDMAAAAKARNPQISGGPVRHSEAGIPLDRQLPVGSFDHNGNIVKKADGGRIEGTSARPTKNGRPASDYELGIGNDDAGAVARGNREPYERMPKAMAKPRSITVERTTVSEAPARQSDLSRRLSRPVPASEMAAARAKAGKGSFRNIPLIGGALDALGLKYGGMAAMPKGKKR